MARAVFAFAAAGIFLFVPPSQRAASFTADQAMLKQSLAGR